MIGGRRTSVYRSTFAPQLKLSALLPYMAEAGIFATSGTPGAQSMAPDVESRSKLGAPVWIVAIDNVIEGPNSVYFQGDARVM